MALRPKLTVPKLDKESFKGWTFVLVVGTVLAFAAIPFFGIALVQQEVQVDEAEIGECLLRARGDVVV